MGWMLLAVTINNSHNVTLPQLEPLCGPQHDTCTVYTYM